MELLAFLEEGNLWPVGAAESLVVALDLRGLAMDTTTNLNVVTTVLDLTPVSLAVVTSGELVNNELWRWRWRAHSLDNLARLLLRAALAFFARFLEGATTLCPTSTDLLALNKVGDLWPRTVHRESRARHL